MVQGLNAAKIDYLCLGNHEFDIGFDRLKKQLSLFKGKIINSNCTTAQVSHLPKYDYFKVGEKTVVVAGLCTGNPSIYTFPVPTMDPSSESLSAVWESAKKDLGVVPDLLMPLTHQFVSEDQQTAKDVSQHAELSKRMPCILGGHEHEKIIQTAGDSLIVKVGQDATEIGFVDIWWTKDEKLKCSCTTALAKDIPRDSDAEALVKKKREHLETMKATPIAYLPAARSSKQVRSQSVNGGDIPSFIMTYVKRGLKSSGVEIALLNGGNIRGRSDYEPGPFTMGHLFKENPWDNCMAIVPIPGSVLADAIYVSRTQPEGQKPGFLHADDGAEVTEEHKLVKVNGEAFDPEKVYTVAVLVHLLTGMDNIKPLVDYFASRPTQIPDHEICKPSKEVVLEVCMKDAWRRLLGRDQWDYDQDDKLSCDELHDAIHGCFDHLDINRDGTVTREECKQFLKSKGAGLVHNMLDTLDSNSDGRISREEIKSIIQ
jgi:2',3'-cyclic-nucleotide 2'-phosphodiesterase (5'-nucleotidase family)